MLSKLWILPIDIRLSAHMSKLRLRPCSYSYPGFPTWIGIREVSWRGLSNNLRDLHSPMWAHFAFTRCTHRN
jgi:hypothetical protein